MDGTATQFNRVDVPQDTTEVWMNVLDQALRVHVGNTISRQRISLNMVDGLMLLKRLVTRQSLQIYHLRRERQL